MAFRYLWGDSLPMTVPVATAKAVAIGDIVGVSGGTLVNAADTTWDTNLATTQAAFAALFAGVAVQQKTANVARVYGNGTDNVIRVEAAGVYELVLASAASLAIGDYLAPAKDSGNALLNTWVKTTVAASGLFVVIEATTSSTAVKARLLTERTLFGGRT